MLTNDHLTTHSIFKDGIGITGKDNLTSPKNFLCDVAGYDFVEEFVTRYFSTFESDRAGLQGLCAEIYFKS